MITVRKLASLKSVTRLRKYPVVLREIESRLRAGAVFDRIYLRDLTILIQDDSDLPEKLRSNGAFLGTMLDQIHNNPDALIRRINTLRHRFLSEMGLEPADWDIFPVQSDSDDRKNLNRERQSFPMAVYLDDLRSPFNIGSIFRTADAFGVAQLFLSPDATSPDHPRARRSAMGCIDFLPWKRQPLSEILTDSPVFALELGGTPLNRFNFPKEGILIVGSEELGVSPDALSTADKSAGRVSIVQGGVKASLNVGVAFGIVMQRWFEYLAENS